MPPTSTYAGTALDCARVVRDWSAEPIADLYRLSETFAFDCWVGNRDLHFKNLALAADTEGRRLLSPVCDQVHTAVYHSRRTRA